MIRPDRIQRALIRYLPLTPAIFLAVLIPRYWVDLPQYDEWDSVTFFEHLFQGSLTASLLFKQANEYRQFFPNLIVVALGWVTRWDIRYDMVVTFVIACLISVNVWRLAARTIQEDPLKFSLLIFLGNLILFSPTQYENWLQGQQMVYYLPILCVTGGILVARSNLATVSKFLICGALSSISTFSSANGVVCWVTVLPVLLCFEWPRNAYLVRWLSVGWLAALGSNIALYLYHYQKPWWSPSPLSGLYHPIQAAIYFLGFVGAPLGLERARLSIIAGSILFASFVCVWFYLLRHRSDRALKTRAIGWLMIGSYSVLTAAMTTIGRVGMGPGQSQSPRYIGFSAYLVIALIFLVNIIASDMQRRGHASPRKFHRLNWAVVIVLVLYQPFMFALSFRKMEMWQTRLQQAKASILLINELPDTLLTKILYPNLSYLADKSNDLDHLGFLRPSLIRTNHLKDFSVNDFDPKSCGFVESSGLVDNQYAARGWATLPDEHRMPDAIILAYDTGAGDEIAFALTHPARTAGAGNSEIGSWQLRFSSAQLPGTPVTVTAWAFSANTGKARRMNGALKIDYR
jgi:hypothetical protein